MADFRIDTDLLSSTAKNYEDKLKEMTDIVGKINKALEGLKNDGWDSKAGKDFINKCENEWSVKVNKYITLTNFLKEKLVEAEREFSGLVESANKLKYKD